MKSYGHKMASIRLEDNDFFFHCQINLVIKNGIEHTQLIKKGFRFKNYTFKFKWIIFYKSINRTI